MSMPWRGCHIWMTLPRLRRLSSKAYVRRGCSSLLAGRCGENEAIISMANSAEFPWTYERNQTVISVTSPRDKLKMSRTKQVNQTKEIDHETQLPWTSLQSHSHLNHHDWYWWTGNLQRSDLFSTTTPNSSSISSSPIHLSWYFLYPLKALVTCQG